MTDEQLMIKYFGNKFNVPYSVNQLDNETGYKNLKKDITKLENNVFRRVAIKNIFGNSKDDLKSYKILFNMLALGLCATNLVGCFISKEMGNDIIVPATVILSFLVVVPASIFGINEINKKTVRSELSFKVLKHYDSKIIKLNRLQTQIVSLAKDRESQNKNKKSSGIEMF